MALHNSEYRHHHEVVSYEGYRVMVLHELAFDYLTKMDTHVTMLVQAESGVCHGVAYSYPGEYTSVERLQSVSKQMREYFKQNFEKTILKEPEGDPRELRNKARDAGHLLEFVPTMERTQCNSTSQQG